MSRYDEFYPESNSIKNLDSKFGIIIGLKLKLISHLNNAKAGDMNAESKLINRIGQLRRNRPSMPEELREELKQAVEYLRSVGRVIDLKGDDPSLWISMRGGAPRW